MKNKKIIEPILGFGFMIGFLLLIIFLIAIYGGALMRVFGFEYKSVGSLMLYFMMFSVVSIPVDIFAQALPKALVSIGKIKKTTARVMFITIDTIGTYCSMDIVDYFMDSVSATNLSILVLSIVLAIISLDREKL